MDRGCDEELAAQVEDYMTKLPNRRVGLDPTGNCLEAKVQDIRWEASGQMGWSVIRVFGWDFTQIDYREHLR